VSIVLKALHGKISKAKKDRKEWGTSALLFKNWGNMKINGFSIAFVKGAEYSSWADTKSENLSWVEEGSGIIEFRNKRYRITKGYAFKVFPGQQPVITPKGKLVIFSVQMPSRKSGKFDVVNVNRLKSKVYEYETLGKEVFTPKIKNSLGLLWFVFPIDKIPLHIHPYSDRIIRTISGKGYTFAEPNLYEMTPDSFTNFPKGTVHTNGPVPGHVYTVYAVQIPWIESKIDEKNIGGSPKFVRYIGPTPPRKLWKTKPDFIRVIKKNSR